ncbi:MAG: hypothetical protein QM734_02800 [Cyclobacteriaceae bacterium]
MASINFTSEERNKFFQPIYKKSDHIMTYAIWAYVAFGLFLATFYNTFAIAIGVGGLCAAAYFISKSLIKSNFYQYVLSAVLTIFSAQFIYQMHGLFEMHFFFFIGATLLITYRNWKLIIPLLLLTVVHHASFAWLQYKGMKEIYFTQLDYMDLQAFIFHALLAAVIMGICGYWSYDLERTTLSEAVKASTLEKQMKNVSKNIAFANEISNGNLNADYNLQDEEDKLGNSLLTMQQNLKSSSAREQEEKFITVGITKIGDIIQQFGSDPDALADEFIRGIVKYSNLNQGGLFLHEGDDEEIVLEARGLLCLRPKEIFRQEN